MWYILSYTFLSVALILIAYQIWMWLKLKPSPKPGLQQPKRVSLIICAKNEATNLEKHIPYWCNQAYEGTFEVIIVDDKSNDETSTIVNKYITQFPNLKYLYNTNTKPLKGKKNALDFGIQHAQYDYILLTDADCIPQSDKWLSEMAAYGENEIVLGYGAYEMANTYLNKWIRWETLHTFLQYSTYAKSNVSYMGVGRNLFYPKKHYFKALDHSTFQTTYNEIPSGDDDLLLQILHKYGKVVVCESHESITISTAPEDWKTYFKQKNRHTSAGKYYQLQQKILLGLYALAHSLFWLIGPSLVVYNIYKWYQGEITCSLYWYNDINIAKCVIFAFVLKILFLSYLLEKKNNLLQSFKTNNGYSVGDAFWAIYNIILSPYILFKNQKKWK